MFIVDTAEQGDLQISTMSYGPLKTTVTYHSIREHLVSLGDTLVSPHDQIDLRNGSSSVSRVQRPVAQSSLTESTRIAHVGPLAERFDERSVVHVSLSSVLVGLQSRELSYGGLLECYQCSIEYVL